MVAARPIRRRFSGQMLLVLVFVASVVVGNAFVLAAEPYCCKLWQYGACCSCTLGSCYPLSGMFNCADGVTPETYVTCSFSACNCCAQTTNQNASCNESGGPMQVCYSFYYSSSLTNCNGLVYCQRADISITSCSGTSC